MEACHVPPICSRFFSTVLPYFSASSAIQTLFCFFSPPQKSSLRPALLAFFLVSGSTFTGKTPPGHFFFRSYFSPSLLSDFLIRSRFFASDVFDYDSRPSFRFFPFLFSDPRCLHLLLLPVHSPFLTCNRQRLYALPSVSVEL